MITLSKNIFPIEELYKSTVYVVPVDSLIESALQAIKKWVASEGGIRQGNAMLQSVAFRRPRIIISGDLSLINDNSFHITLNGIAIISYYPGKGCFPVPAVSLPPSPIAASVNRSVSVAPEASSFEKCCPYPIL